MNDLSLLLLLGQVLADAVLVRLHGLLSRAPSGGADFAVFVGELEGLDQPQSLVDVSAHGQIVDGHLAEGAGAVDDEEAAEGDALVLLENSVRSGDFQVLVGEQGDVHLAQSSLLPGGVGPGQMGEMRVGGASDDFTTDFAELLGALRERDDFGGTNEREVQRVKEDYNIFALEVIKANFFESAFDDGLSLEDGSFLARLQGFSTLGRIRHFC